MSLDPYFEPGQGGDNAFTVEAPKIKFGPGSLREIGDDAKAFPQKPLLDNSPMVPDRDQLKELFRESLRYW